MYQLVSKWGVPHAPPGPSRPDDGVTPRWAGVCSPSGRACPKMDVCAGRHKCPYRPPWEVSRPRLWEGRCLNSAGRAYDTIGFTARFTVRPRPVTQKPRQSIGSTGFSMVGVARIELATPAMSTQCSTTELYAHGKRAISGGRTIVQGEILQFLRLSGAPLPRHGSKAGRAAAFEDAIDLQHQVLQMERLR